jgi:hypothetical protein
MHKESFIISRNTLLHVSTQQGLSAVRDFEARPADSSRLQKATQYTVNSTFSLNCKVEP